MPPWTMPSSMLLLFLRVGFEKELPLMIIKLLKGLRVARALQKRGWGCLITQWGLALQVQGLSPLTGTCTDNLSGTACSSLAKHI